MLKTVTAITTFYDGWWLVEVPEIRGLYSQARTLEEVEPMVREAAELMDEGIGDITVRVVDEEHFCDEAIDEALYREAVARERNDSGERYSLEEVVGADYVPVDDGYEPEFE